jgi:rod shape-determining protein MreD
MRYLVLAAVAVINLIFAGAVFPNINIAGLVPDLVVCSMASIAILEKRMTGAIIGFICGLVLDLFLIGVVGFNAIPYLVTGAILVSVVKRITYFDRFLIPMGIAAGAYLVREILTGLLSYMLGNEFSLGYIIVRYTIPEMMITALFMLPIHLLLTRIYRSPSVRPQNPEEFKRL